MLRIKPVHFDAPSMIFLTRAGSALSAGRLVRPFALAVRADSSYYLVADRGRLKQPLVKAFRSWIKGRLAAAETAGA